MLNTRDNHQTDLGPNEVDSRCEGLFLITNISSWTDFDPNRKHSIVFSILFGFYTATVGIWGCFSGLLATKSVKATEIWWNRRSKHLRDFSAKFCFKNTWMSELTALPHLQEGTGGERETHQVSENSNAEFSRYRHAEWRMSAWHCPL